MRWLAGFLAALALSLCAGAANAALAVTTLSGNAAASVSSVTVTTNNDSPLGNTIVCIVADNNLASAISSVTDSASNTYTEGTLITVAGGGQSVEFYTQNAAHLVSGGTIVAHFGASTATMNIIRCITIAGANTSSFDVEGAGTKNGTNVTNPTVTSPTLNFPNEVVVAWDAVIGGSNIAFTNDASFTNVPGSGDATHQFINWGYKIVSVTTAVTYAPTQASAPQTMNIVGFSGPTASVKHGLTTTGAG